MLWEIGQKFQMLIKSAMSLQISFIWRKSFTGIPHEMFTTQISNSIFSDFFHNIPYHVMKFSSHNKFLCGTIACEIPMKTLLKRKQNSFTFKTSIVMQTDYQLFKTVNWHVTYWINFFYQTFIYLTSNYMYYIYL